MLRLMHYVLLIKYFLQKNFEGILAVLTIVTILVGGGYVIYCFLKLINIIDLIKLLCGLR